MDTPVNPPKPNLPKIESVTEDRAFLCLLLPRLQQHEQFHKPGERLGEGSFAKAHGYSQPEKAPRKIKIPIKGYDIRILNIQVVLIQSTVTTEPGM